MLIDPTSYASDPAANGSETEMQLKGYRLSTAQILYHMPDHPDLLQSFLWQHYDIAPKFPELHKFLDFWVEEIEGPLHSVHVARLDLVGTPDTRHADAWMRIH